VPPTAKKTTKQPKRHLVQEVADRLRQHILEREPGAQIGSLNDVAQLLDVGIVTVQQVARILEHEGLLAVRRGPGGGYYGARPDEAALERSMATYMRIHGFGYREALEMTTLLDCDIAPAAARCTEESLRSEMRELLRRIGNCDTREQRASVEVDLRELLFRVVSSPLMELVLRITTHFYKPESDPPVFSGEGDILVWKNGRQNILEAILANDEELARFEAERFRRQVLQRLHQHT
jgi:DNA-binding FadR family transcriptional regulator